MYIKMLIKPMLIIKYTQIYKCIFIHFFHAFMLELYYSEITLKNCYLEVKQLDHHLSLYIYK
jgi:hypothetical protein